MFDKIDKPQLMGILNITPDSFSDGGKFLSINPALDHARKMIEEGVDIIDIGGESTRPGSKSVAVAEQISRVVPVIEAIRNHVSAEIPISIDTTHVKVVEAAMTAGANIINDISAGRNDPKMFECAAKYDVPIILMHMQGIPESMQDRPCYDSVVDEIIEFLLERIEVAIQAGIKPENIAIDPGIGFGKRKRDNLELMAHLDQFVDTGYSVLLGASRKRFMGEICQVSEPDELVTATAVTTAMGVMAGVRLFRVHDISENRQAADVAWAIKQAD